LGPNGLDGVAQVSRVPLLGMIAEARPQLGQGHASPKGLADPQLGLFESATHSLVLPI